MRRFLAFLLTKVLRIAHETIPLAAMRIVAARTRYDPHAICGTKSKTSMRKERRASTRVRMLSIKIPSRYLGECDGECRCAAPASTSMIRVKSAATGWIIRIAESVVLVAVGKSKLAAWESLKRFVVSYPISILLHSFPLQNPNTPKSTPPKEASGICLMIGVESTEMSRRANAANSSTVSGVAGLNMMKSSR
jgi:hypothetical protein